MPIPDGRETPVGISTIYIREVALQNRLIEGSAKLEAKLTRYGRVELKSK
jgi:hypothetical protein